jgi:Fe-Mn family superoxide dismutase
MIQAKNFPYNTDLVTQKQYDAHIRLYNGYVASANTIMTSPEDEKILKDANPTFSQFRERKKGLSYSLNGVILHECYFENIQKSDKTATPPEQLFAKWGGYEKWKDFFAATAKSARGWAVLAYEQRSKQFVNVALDWHDYGNITHAVPLIVLDMYEHAYFHDYLDNKAAYIDKFFTSISWEIICSRFDKMKGLL